MAFLYHLVLITIFSVIMQQTLDVSIPCNYFGHAVLHLFNFISLYIISIQLFHNSCATNINTAGGLFSHFWIDNYFQDGRHCKWVSRNESHPIEEIFDWPIDCSSLKYENDILQLHKRKPCLKVVIWGVKMMANFVTMYVWQAWNQNLSIHLPECSALSWLLHLNRITAHGLWNSRIISIFNPQSFSQFLPLARSVHPCFSWWHGRCRSCCRTCDTRTRNRPAASASIWGRQTEVECFHRWAAGWMLPCRSSILQMSLGPES